MPDWKNVPIRNLLEEWTGVPVTLSSYASTLAIAERARRPKNTLTNLLCVEVEDTIGSLEPDDIIQKCATTGDAVLCGLIHRDAAGTLWLLDGYVDTANQNIGRLGARGVDVTASYPWNLGGSGFISLSLIGTYLLENSFTNRVIEYDCAGHFGNQCWQPNARWRHRFRASWQTGFNATISLGWRFIGSTVIDDASDNPDLADPDLVESWRINGAYENPVYNFKFGVTYTSAGY